MLSLSLLASIIIPIRGGGHAQAASNNTLNFQSRILMSAGNVVPDGDYNIRFKIYDGGTQGGGAGIGAANAGTLLWTETWQNSNSQGITTKNGYISANLGSITALTGIKWDQELWITMDIGGTSTGASPTYDGEMLQTGNKRMKVTGVPYALAAGKIQTTDSAGANTSSLSIVAPTGGSQVFQLQDQTVAGTYNLALLNGNGTQTFTGLNTFSAAGTALTVTNNASIGGTLGVTGLTTATGGLTTGAFSTFTNGGTTVNTSLPIGDLNYTGTGNTGAIGTAAATVDKYTNFTIAQTTAGQTLTIPAPTTSVTGRLIYITNVGSAGYTISGSVVSPGTTTAFVWNTITSAWTLVSSGTTGNYIQNGTSVQTANFNIQSNSTSAVTAMIQGANSQSADILDVKAASVTDPLFSIGNTGAVVFENSSNSANAFQVKTQAAGSVVLNVNTTTPGVTVNGTFTTSGGTVNINTGGSGSTSIGSASVTTAITGGITLSTGGANNVAITDGTNNYLQFVGGTSILNLGNSTVSTSATNINAGATGYINLNQTTKVTGDLTFVAGASRLISVANQTAGNTAGNALTMQAGSGFGTGAGGALTLQAGNSGAGATGAGGAVAVTAGNASSTNGAGGAITITSGASKGTGTSGAITISTSAPATTGGTSGTGSLTLSTGADTAFGGTAGSININAGAGNNPGAVNISAGAGNNAGNGANGAGVSIYAGNGDGAWPSLLDAGNGGNVDIYAGTGGIATAGGANGVDGSVNIHGLLQGMNSASITGTLGVSGLTTLSGGLQVTNGGNIYYERGTNLTATGTQNDYNIGAGSTFIITSISSLTITGITNGANGRLITLVNASGSTVTINNNGAGSTAANRIATGTGGNISIPSGASIQLIYDGSTPLWRVIGSAAATGGYIQLQGSTPGTAQTGNFNISGTGIADIIQGTTEITTPLLDTPTSVVLNIGTTNATQINLNQTTVVASGKRLQVGTIGTPTAQLYVSGQVPTSQLGSVNSDSTTPARPTSLLVQGKYAYAINSTTNTLQVIDISNPASPARLGSVALGFTPSQVPMAISGQYVYVYSGTVSQLKIFDISNPSAPVLVSTLSSTATNIGNIAVQGRFLYLSDKNNNSVRVFDVGNPKAPYSLSFYPNSTTGIANVVVKGSYAYVGTACNTSTTVLVLNISNPQNITQVGSWAGSQCPSGMPTVSGNRLYVPEQGGTIDILNVADPTNPVLLGTATPGSAAPFTVDVSGRYIYVSDSTSAHVYITDVSDPTSPANVGTIATSGTTYAASTQGRYLYVANRGTSVIQSFDLGGSYEQQAQVGSLQVSNEDVSNDLTVGGNLGVTGGITANNAIFTGSVSLLTGSVFTNSGATLNTTISITDKPSGGNIGTAPNTVDIGTTFAINQTTTGQALTLPTPTDTTSGRIVYVINTGSASYTMHGVTSSAGSAQSFIWNGSTWTVDGSGTLGNYIANGTSAQSANFNVQSAAAGSVAATIQSNAAQTADTAQIILGNTSGSQTNGLYINRSGAGGTTTNGLNVTSTSGTLSNGITVTSANGQTIGNGLNFATSGTGTFTNLINSANFVVTNAGNLTAGTYNGDTLNSTTLTFSGANPTISASTANTGLTVQAPGTGILTLNTVGAGTVNVGTASTTTVSISNASAVTNIAGSTINLNTPTLKRTASGTTAFDLNDAANTTLALQNSGTGVANLTVDGSVTGTISVLTPLLDAATAATALNIGTTNANQINLKQNTLLTGNLTLANGADRVVSVANQTAGNTAGNQLTLQSGTGFGAANGGALTLQAGNSGSGLTGNGGALNITGGSSVSNAGSGGTVTITGGADTSGSGGSGGDVIINPGNSTNGTNGQVKINTLGIAPVVIGSTGNTQSILTVNSATTITGLLNNVSTALSVVGGTTTAAASNVLSVTGQTYSTAAASGNGAAAGYLITASGGAGQAASATTGVTGGTGSLINLQAGTGGAATGATGFNTGGSGGAVTIKAGNGGNVTSASGVSGDGGSLSIQGGAPGTGGVGGASYGPVSIQTVGGSVSIGNNSTTYSTNILGGGITVRSATGGVNLTSNNGSGANTGGVSLTTGAVTSGAFTSGSVTIDTGTSTGTVGSVLIGTTTTNTITVGRANTNVNLSLQGGASSTFSATNATGTTALGFAAPSTAGTVTYQLPAGATAGTYTICTTTQNCSTAGSGYVLNQSSTPGSAQTGNINMTGTIIGANLQGSTNVTSPLFDSISGGLSVGTSVATGVTIGGTTNTTAISLQGAVAATYTIGTATGTGQITVGQSSATNTISIGSAVGAGNTQTIGIGTSTTGTTAVTVGSNTTTGTISLQAGNITLGNTTNRGTVTNNGGTFMATLTVNDDSNGGALGGTPAGGLTAAQSVDSYTSIGINQTTAGQTITLPNSASTIGRVLYVTNIGTTSFIISGTTFGIGSTATMFWTGSAWTFAGMDGGSSNYIQNQTVADQAASFRISGTGAINTTSAIAFKIQSAAGADAMFTVDTSAANQVKVGNNTGTGASTTVFVLDTATTAPTANGSGVNGSMYYDSTKGHVQCYENGVWGDCGNTSLQLSYTNSSGGTTPEIIVDATRRGFDVQDLTGGSLGTTEGLFNVRGVATASTLGASLFTVQGNGRVGINNGSTSTTPAVSYDLSFGQITGVTTARTIGVETQATATIGGNGLTVSAGTGNTTGVGGTLSLQGGIGGNAAAGGAVFLTGGAAGGGNTNGGSITIAGGAAAGTGVQGVVNLSTTAFSAAAPVSFAANNFLNTLLTNATNLYSTIPVNATASGLTLTVDLPTITTVGRILYITAVNGSNDFGLLLAGTSVNISMKANSTATLIYNGTGWTAAGASSSTTLQAAYDNTLISAGGSELLLNNSTAGGDGLTIRNNTGAKTITGALLEVQTNVGSNLFSVNNNATEYANNGGAETATFTMWPTAPNGGTTAAITRDTATFATGIASTKVVTTGATTANQGVANTLTAALSANLQYAVSFTVKSGTANSFSTLDTVYSRDGTNTSTVACATGSTVTASAWTRVTCTFTAPATAPTSSNAIFIRQSNSNVSAQTYYIDNLSVTVNAGVNHAIDGSVDSALGTNWVAIGGSVARDTTTIYDTSGSVAVTTSATAGRGVYNNLTAGIIPAVSTQYRVSFYANANSGTATLAVAYTPDNNSTSVSCQDYNAQVITAGSWQLITCIITTSATTPVTSQQLRITQTAGAATIFYVDALTMTLSNNNASNVQIGGANKGGPTTLLTLDRASTAPIAANNDAYLGSMYYDTTTGRIQCYEADGWGACGSAPDNIVNLNPEYAGAVLNGTGVGTMTTDFCGNGGGLSINTALCTSGQARNYYKWTSPQATQQTYSIYVTYQLPATFKAFASDATVNLTGRVDDNANAAVTYQMFSSNGTTITACGTETDVIGGVGNNNTWMTTPINGNEATGACGFTPGGFVIFKVNLKANSGKNAYAGTLSFTTTGK